MANIPVGSYDGGGRGKEREKERDRDKEREREKDKESSSRFLFEVEKVEKIEKSSSPAEEGSAETPTYSGAETAAPSGRGKETNAKEVRIIDFSDTNIQHRYV